jgi:hypothetical protein
MMQSQARDLIKRTVLFYCEFSKEHTDRSCRLLGYDDFYTPALAHERRKICADMNLETINGWTKFNCGAR